MRIDYNPDNNPEMKITSSYICLDKARFHAYHGLLPMEQIVGDDFILSMRVAYDFTRAAVNDDIEHTVSYAALYNIAREEMMTASKLLEHVVWRIARHIFNTFPETIEIWLSLTKSNPPIGGDSQGATIIATFTADNIKK